MFEAFRGKSLSFELLDRHLIVIGQSGSGKSYFLGRYVEEIALKTLAKVLILDRAGDFVKLALSPDGKGSSGIKTNVHSQWSGRGLESLEFREIGVHPSWFDPLDVCASIGLPAVPDNWGAIAEAQRRITREQYDFHELAKSLAELDPRPDHIIARLNGIDQLTEGLLTRYRFGTPSEVDTPTSVVKGCLDPEPRLRQAEVHVVDISSLKSDHARHLVVLSILRAIWHAARKQWWQRHLSGAQFTRTPFFVVADEAHHLCPQERPDGALANRVRDALVELATEGRKYGLWLVIGTQRPTRLHPSLLFESSNLLLMRTTSPADLAALHSLVGRQRFPPLATLERKRGFCYLAGEWSDGKFKRVQVSTRRSVHPEGGFGADEWVPKGTC